MEAIDTLEKGLPFNQVSKMYLNKLCLNQKVKIEKTVIEGDRIIGH